ncbi:MAG: hypothetical protein AAF726_02985 [Planctomycetota bacterium]
MPLLRTARDFVAAVTFLAAAAGAAPAPNAPQSAVEFAWGDVFQSDAATLDNQLCGALELPSGRTFTFSFGGVAGYGIAYGLYGSGLEPIFFVDRDSGPIAARPLLVRTLDVVETDAQGGPVWDQVVTRVLVVRPGDGADVAPETYVERLVSLARARGAPPRPREASKVGGTAAVSSPALVDDVRIVAHDLATTDLTVGTFTGPRGESLAWEVQSHAHRTKRDLYEVDLASPESAQFAASSFVPSGLAGNGVTIESDTAYDSSGVNLGRRLARLRWTPAAVLAQRVGFEFDVTDSGAPRDLSTPTARLVFSVAGSDVDCLSVSLTDETGARDAALVDLEQITPYEQTVVLPLDSFQGVDLSRSMRLGFSVRDPLAPSNTCEGGELAIFAPRVSVASPYLSTPQNVFWSNDPLQDASGGPSAPLTDSFLGQPTSVYKYFVGVSGPSIASANQIVAEIGAIRAADLTPHVVIELFPAAGSSTLNAIVSGAYDAFFTTIFTGCRSIGGRIELAPLHEANGFWYPWRGDLQPGTLRNAWQRIDLLRDDARAHNVALAYVVSCLETAPGVQRAAASGFPGDDVVDMIGIQGFESGYDGDVVRANEVFTATTEILDRLSDLPFVLTEYGFFTVPGAEYEKGQLATWALDDQIAARSFQPYSGAIYFNVSKFENGAFRNWRLLQDNGQPLTEVLPYIFGLESRASNPVLRSVAEGRRASDAAHRRHSRLFARLTSL